MRQMNSFCGAGKTLSGPSLERDGTVAGMSSSGSWTFTWLGRMWGSTRPQSMAGCGSESRMDTVEAPEEPCVAPIAGQRHSQVKLFEIYRDKRLPYSKLVTNAGFSEASRPQ